MQTVEPTEDSARRLEAALQSQRETERALREALAQLEAERADGRLLQEISAELTGERTGEQLCETLVDAAARIMRSDCASIQMLHPERGGCGELRLLAHRGFTAEAARFWQWVRLDSMSSCGKALRSGERVVVPDIGQCDYMADTDDLATYVQAGIRSVQTTPLLARSGTCVGMISTHWREPHLPSERDFRVLDVVARQAADLIEQLNAQERVRQREERLRAIFDCAAVGAAILTPEGRFIRVNDAFCAICGYSPEELAALTCADITHADDRADADALIAQVLAGVSPRAMIENRYLRKDGALVWVQTSVSMTRDAAGAPLHLIVLAQDITAQVHSRAAIAESERRLRESDRRKDEFLAQLAHELRNPLAPIRNAAQLLGFHGAGVRDHAWVRDVIERQVSHLTRLIDDLLDVSRVTRGKLELRNAPVALHAVVAAAVETANPVVAQHGHELIVSLPDEPVHLHGDLVRLAQVLTNLITNAAKYSAFGQPITLRAEVEQANGGASRALAVRVKDNGVGIPAAALPHVFDMFYQVEASLERSRGGLGIGLSLARRLVELHGGSVSAHSDGPGKGSEFVVRLPVHADIAIAATLPACDAASERVVPTRILLADDNRDAADALAMLLRLEGHDVHLAHDGVEAVQAASALAPDVVLLDIGMPKLNGYDACRRIRGTASGRHIALFALTGFGQQQDRIRSEDAGFDGHFVKPIDLEALRRRLASLSARP